MKRLLLACFSVVLPSFVECAQGRSYGAQPNAVATCGNSSPDRGNERGLVGYWKLQGDCRDYSGQGNHGVSHGVNLDGAVFNGADAYVEVPNSDSLKLGAGDFSLCAWICTEKELDDVVGDVIDMYDPAVRRGITLSVNSSARGYQSQGDDRHVYFGIDNARMSDWQDCGRPSRTANYVSNSMTVYRGHLYAGIASAGDQNDWCHVFRYQRGQRWTDCGRVGDGKTTGVGPLIVHGGDLYAITSTIDWTRVKTGGYDPGHVYRYAGGSRWEDCGQPSVNRTLNCAASYKGRMYVGGGPEVLGVYTQGDGSRWRPSKIFPTSGPHTCFPHPMCVFNGRLYTAFPGVFAFDGQEWAFCGVPSVSTILQTHSLQVYQGKLCAGTWPEARVSVYQGGESWTEIGRVGQDGTEVNALQVYNGKLYAGSLPRSEVCRYDGDLKWTSLMRFYSPEGWTPASPTGPLTREQVNEWARLTCLTVYDGKLFASTGSCTSSLLDAPCDVRGKVFCMEAGKCVSYDDDIGPGWHHLAAIRGATRLKLYVDGRPVKESASFDPAQYDLSTDQPLRIGFGQSDYFAGKIREVRVYNKALTDAEIQTLADRLPAAETWTDISTPLIEKLKSQGEKLAWPGGCAGIVADRLTGCVVVKVVGAGLWRSADQGATWQRIDGGTVSGRDETGWATSVDQDHPQRMASFSLDGLAGWTTDGEKWQSFADNGRNWDFGSVDWSAAVPQTIIVAKHETDPPGEVDLSTDSGRTWRKLSIRLNGKQDLVAMVGALDAKTLVYSNGQGILRSTDAGATWTQVSAANPLTRVPVSFRGVAYLGTETGLLVSKDRGATWQTQGTPVKIQQGPLFGEDERTMVALGSDGAFLTQDAGQNWTHVAALKPNGRGQGFSFATKWFGCYAWDPVNNILYASTMGNPACKLELGKLPPSRQ